MSRTSLEVKARRKPKFSARAYNRCPICGRARAYMRAFGLCRGNAPFAGLSGYIS